MLQCCETAGKGGEGGVLDVLLCWVWLVGNLQRWCEGGKSGEDGEGGGAIAGDFVRIPYAVWVYRYHHLYRL